MTAPLTDLERLAWWRLSRTDGIGPITFFRLIDRYQTASRALDNITDLSRRGGRKTPLTPFARERAEAELAALHKIGARTVTAADPDYPVALTTVDDAPPILTVFGHTSVWQKPCVAIVGARNASLPGRKMADRLAKGLGQQGYTVVSGLARGIDQAAHEGSVATGTVAVVAGGPDIIYPPENADLYNRIKAEGAIISEHPAGLEPKAPHFPRRNRVISGLSLGTVVVEATTQSGSLITAHCALNQNRDVFAVPGSPLDPRASGPNQLIRDGATLVEHADHIISHLTLFKGRALREEPLDLFTANTSEPAESDLEQARAHIISLLSPTPLAVDELVRSCQWSIPVVQTVLLELELAGALHRLPGNRIALSGEEENSERERAGHR